ncbi:unnamed protein product [Paramecium sonneborni]|uniref:Uncharacterized protein n=1 Tax=Paramecium sonneborni TaxID=65129 RepID=A0A8S1QSR0_9CILI|nr:unnamed protein product [Paramecium sonneborni]
MKDQFLLECMLFQQWQWMDDVHRGIEQIIEVFESRRSLIENITQI